MMFSIFLFGIFPTAAAIIFAYVLLCHRRSSSKQDGVPEGTMGVLPFIGETLAFLKPHHTNSLGAFSEQRCSRYGTVFKSHLFGIPAIVSCDLALNNFILQNEEKLFQSSYPRAMHSILGETSLLLVNGTLHKKIRSVVTGFIGASKTNPRFLDSIQHQTLKLLKEWEERKLIAFQKESKRFAFSLVVMLFMSIEPEDPIAKAMMADILTFMEGFISYPIPIPGTKFWKALRARRRLFASVKSIITKRERGNGAQVSNKRDYVDLVLTKDLKVEDKVTSVLDMLLGSHETTATLMALIVYFLEKASHVLQALKDEHQAIRDEKGDVELLNLEDYQRMEFTQCEKEMVKRVTPFGGGLRLCPGKDIARVEISFFPSSLFA